MSREDNKKIYEENKVIVRNNFYIKDGKQVSFEFNSVDLLQRNIQLNHHNHQSSLPTNL